MAKSKIKSDKTKTQQHWNAQVQDKGQHIAQNASTWAAKTKRKEEMEHAEHAL